jgi:hypothetical protein
MNSSLLMTRSGETLRGLNEWINYDSFIESTVIEAEEDRRERERRMIEENRQRAEEFWGRWMRTKEQWAMIREERKAAREAAIEADWLIA